MSNSAFPNGLVSELLAAVPPALALLAGMQLGVFTAIGENAVSAGDLAARLGVDPDRLSRLLYALVVTGVLRVDDGTFTNTPEGKALLVEGKPGSLASSHELYAKLWKADLNTEASIRLGIPMAEHDFVNAFPDEAIAFLRGSMASAKAFGRAIATQFDLSDCRSVIDIGGGPGGVLLGLREHLPDLRTTLFELPQVLQHVSRMLADQGSVEDLELEAGDITLATPQGRHDAAILRAVVQVLAPDDARLAIRHASQALLPGGRLFVSGWGILDDDRLGPRNGVFVNLTFLNLYRSGQAYTENEYRTWMEESGITGVARTQLPDGTEVIWGSRKG